VEEIYWKQRIEWSFSLYLANMQAVGSIEVFYLQSSNTFMIFFLQNLVTEFIICMNLYYHNMLQLQYQKAYF
jgi:hypothetical protein